MADQSKKYDLILVHSIVRKNPYYLNIIKYLSKDFKIGVFVPWVPKGEKFRELEDLFLSLCLRLGADILNRGSYSCRLALIFPFGYDDEVLEKIKKMVCCDRMVGILQFGRGLGVTEGRILDYFGITTLLVQDISFFLEASRRQDRDIKVIEKYKLIEVGLPFGRYPIFEEDWDIDFIVAMPTGLSLPSTKHKIIFLSNILNILRSLPANKRVFLKLHNAKKDTEFQFYTRSNSWLRQMFKHIPLFLAEWINWLLGFTSRWAQLDSFDIIKCACMYYELLGRALPLSALTPYHILGLEFFLPYVKSGIITGRSSILYSCLYERVPVYNCDDEEVMSLKPKAVDICPDYTGIRPCHGDLYFDPRYFENISDAARRGDLTSEVKNLISECIYA